ncbi:MAG: hypothetical protein GYA45_11650 [Pelolinea sp.]|nr:hypothetical protein [Pelolinea sp.]
MNDQIAGEINELLQELVAERGLKKPEPGDVTAEMMAKATGYKPKYCAQLLREKVLAGVVEKVRVLGPDGSPMTVYRKVKK